jgi:glutamine synthetase
MDQHGDTGYPESKAGAIASELAAREVYGVVLGFVDTSGITRVKGIPLARLAAAARSGVGMSPCFDTFLFDDSSTATADLGGPDGDLRLFPDLGAIVPLAAQPGWAWAPVDRYLQDGSRYPACQRGFAEAMTERAREAGLQVRMAFEVECALGTEDGGRFVAACDGPAYSMTRLIATSDLTRDLIRALSEENVAVEQVHPEYAPGQLEVSVAPADPVAAADRSVLVRQTIRAIAARHGLGASFAPAVVPGQVGNGGHVHLSLWREGRNLYSGGDRRHGLTGEGEAFIAGLLSALPALCAIGAPSVASYLRLVPSRWAGSYACWGHETREAAIRLVADASPAQRAAQAANVEVKCFDLAANPYLVAGSLIAAGLAGVAEGAELPPEIHGDPATWPPGELARLGVSRLPCSLDEATDALAACATLREAMGSVLSDAIIAVRRAEVDLLGGRTPAEVAAATRWIY